MKTIVSLWLLVLLTAPARSADFVVVSAGGKLTVFEVEGKALADRQTIDLEGSSGPMGLSPDGTKLYVNTTLSAGDQRKPVPAFATFAISPEGDLERLHVAATPWNSGYLRPDATGSFFAGNHYGKGKVGIWRLDPEGVYRGEMIRDFDLERCAHAAVFSPDNRFLFVPATGPNKIFQLVFDEGSGEIHPNQPSSAPGPEGEGLARQPRHLIFHPGKPIAYTTNERELPGAGVWRYDPETGLLESIQSVVSVPRGDEGMTTADLHLTPDLRFLYVSNRDIANRGKPEGRDSIALFAVNGETGLLEFVDRFPCERIPRSFAMDPAGRFLFVGGQGDDRLGMYAIDPKSGRLDKTGVYDLPGTPAWVSVFVRN